MSANNVLISLLFSFQSDIVDVNTIFKDLATMVHEQGEFVDSIEANVEATQVRVSEGTEQLRQAEQYKVSLIKVLLACFVVVTGLNIPFVDCLTGLPSTQF